MFGHHIRRMGFNMKKQRLIALLSFLLLLLLVCGFSTEHPRNAAVSFGPVRERVLPFGTPCRQYLFQFRNGEIFVDGHGPGTTTEQAERDQKTIDDAGGVDLFTYGGKARFQLTGEVCLFSRGPRDLSWEKTAAEQVIARMRQVHFVKQRKAGEPINPFAEVTGGGSGMVEHEAMDLPVTYYIKTSRGEIGVMEIVGLVEDERGYSGDGKGYGMKFRYKVVQGGQ
jgi:hypothetical protein